MIKVIEHGNKNFIGNCEKCGCKFSYEISDVYIGIVHCPECNYPVTHPVQILSNLEYAVPNKELPPLINSCDHDWRITGGITSSGRQYYCTKCGRTKMEPWDCKSYYITLEKQND